MLNLTDKQWEQENDYNIGPYHWFKKFDTMGGRLYFGYLAICRSFVEKDSRDNLQVLDAGCGDGRFCKELIDTNKCQVTGVDYSQKAISFSRLLLPEANFVLADLVKLPFENETYDFIYLIEILEHIIPNNIENVLGGLHRVLKKDGLLIITVPSLFNGEPTPESKHYQHFTKESLKNTVEKFFIAEKIFGQDKVGFHILKLFYKFLDNKYWDLKILKKYYNRNIWPKFFNQCSADKSRRLIAVCRKK